MLAASSATAFCQIKLRASGIECRLAISSGGVLNMLDSFAKEITRRGFINKIGQGLVAANFADALLKVGDRTAGARPSWKEDGVGNRWLG